MSSPYFKPCICSFDKSPKYNRENPYLLHGYRKNFNGVWECLKSLFMLTNETVNVWSHVIGVVWFLYEIVDLNINVLPSYKLSTVSECLIIILKYFIFSERTYFIFSEQTVVMGTCTTLYLIYTSSRPWVYIFLITPTQAAIFLSNRNMCKTEHT